ncbi:MAG TPA: hypothetical protein VIL66_02315 [Bacillota bacterium]
MSASHRPRGASIRQAQPLGGGGDDPKNPPMAGGIKDKIFKNGKTQILAQINPRRSLGRQDES